MIEDDKTNTEKDEKDATMAMVQPLSRMDKLTKCDYVDIWINVFCIYFIIQLSTPEIEM